MFQMLKVWVMRKYYRLISAWRWRGHVEATPYRSLQIPGDTGPIPARVYTHNTAPDKPLIIYFHGGGWVIGDLDTHHPYCQTLSARSGCTVVAIDYRLAPEHPFPAATDDALAATRWIANHTAEVGPGNGKLVIAGGSAGANLTICTSLALDAGTLAKIIGNIVFYPAVDHYSAEHFSYTERARGHVLSRSMMIWFWDTYLNGYRADDPKVRCAFPLHSDNLAVLASVFLITAEYDPLRDEGIAFAEKLRAAGTPLYYRHFDTAVHDFACSEGPNKNLDILMDDLLAWLENLT